MFAKILKNDVLANLAFLIIVFIGIYSYTQMPRQQDPEINFNWIQVVTAMPGASAEDVEQRITSPLEDAIQNISDIRFVTSQSRDNLSSILIRFNELSTREFDKRVTDLRREIQNKESELPDNVESPFIFEVTSSNGFPTATVLVTGPAYDENLRRYAKRVNKDLTKFKEIDRITYYGFTEPELHINFDPQRLIALGLNPTDISNNIASVFRDSSAGDINIGNQSWLVRLQGVFNDPDRVGDTRIRTANGAEVAINSFADVETGREEFKELVSYRGKPAIMLSIAKTANTNTFDLLEKIKTYIDERNIYSDQIGAQLVLVDDQTELTRNALRIMQSNAIIGLLMVLLVTFLFLGLKMSLLTSIAIPFVLAGVFFILHVQAETLNVLVLVGIIISLGMLVDDAVVVVESIYYRLERGADAVTASIEGLKEVVAPVTASVLTTIAVFLPLMLLPGILGEFMKLVPYVVTLALILSLLEAYWMLPAHIIGFKVKLDNSTGLQQKRQKFLGKLRNKYTKLLIKALRYPLGIISAGFGAFVLAIALIGSGAIKADFFAGDTLRIFYINIEMPSGTPLETTLAKTEEIEAIVRDYIKPEELRSLVSVSGQQFTETAPSVGSVFGQITVSLNPKTPQMSSVEDIISGLDPKVKAVLGPVNSSFLRLSGGPPTTLPIELKIQGDDLNRIRAAVSEMMRDMENIEGVRDIKSDDSLGQKILLLELNLDAIIQAGLDSDTVRRTLNLMVDGEIVSAFQDAGEEVRLRVKAAQGDLNDIDEILSHSLLTPSGNEIPLNQLVNASYKDGPIQIVHFNFLRTITVLADIDSEITDTRTANEAVTALWESKLSKYPDLQVETVGLLDDINESLANLLILYCFGIALMYCIIATQFRSYFFQPFIILLTVFLAFIGVVFGLVLSQQPFSLYVLYGGVALTGISVNSAIVMISAANDRRRVGMNVLHATVLAARRRVVPILITSMTTIAGLFSLAVGIGGKSAIWGAIATVIVSGLLFSTTLTLFLIPSLYLAADRIKKKIFGAPKVEQKYQSAT